MDELIEQVKALCDSLIADLELEDAIEVVEGVENYASALSQAMSEDLARRNKGQEL